MIGGLTFVLYYTVLWIFFSYSGMPYYIAVAIAYTTAIAFHFLANRNITFNAGGSTFLPQILTYLSVAVMNYFVQLSVIYLCYEMYKINFYISTLIGVILTMVTGYLLMNAWVFKREKL